MSVAAWPCLPNSQKKKAKICWAFAGPLERFKSWLGYLKLYGSHNLPPFPGWIKVKVISKRWLGQIPIVPYVPPGLFWIASPWPNQSLKKWQHRYCHRIHSKTASISRASLTSIKKWGKSRGSLVFCKPRFAYLVKNWGEEGRFFKAKICLDFFCLATETAMVQQKLISTSNHNTAPWFIMYLNQF